MGKYSYYEIIKLLNNYKKLYHKNKTELVIDFVGYPETHNALYKCNLKCIVITNDCSTLYVDVRQGKLSCHENENLVENVMSHQLHAQTQEAIHYYIKHNFDVDYCIAQGIAAKNKKDAEYAAAQKKAEFDSYSPIVQPIVATFANQFIQKRQMLLDNDIIFTNQLLISKAKEEIARLEKTIESAKKQNDVIYNEVANERQQTIGDLKKSCDCFKNEVVNIAVEMFMKEIK